MIWFFAVLVLLCILFYLYSCESKKYWQKQGVPYASKCHWLYGNLKEIFSQKKHMGEVFNEIYWEHSDKAVVGYMKLSSPGLMVRDPELVKAVLSTDFNYFAKNELEVNKKSDKLLGHNPFVLQGEEWKSYRSNATPTVTYLKLKNYFPSIMVVGNELSKHLTKLCEAGGGVTEFETKALSNMYTTDVISNAIYGIENNTFLDPNSLFATLTAEVFRPDFIEDLKLKISVFIPTLGKILGIRFSTKRAERILTTLTKQKMKEKANSDKKSSDIFQHFFALRQSGKADIFTDEYVASLLYMFLLDGYETSSILIAFVLYELAWNKECQEKLRNEIRDLIAKTDGNYTVDDVEGLKYLGMVVQESLRLNTTVALLTKCCTSDYQITNAKGINKPITVKKGTIMAIPVSSLHMDPQYYPDPTKFVPERFTEDEIAKRHKFVYLPFGGGPRACFGQRFGLLQSKLAIIKIIEKFHLTPNPKSKYPVPIDPTRFLLKYALGGSWVSCRSI